MKPVTVTMYVYQGDALIATYEDVVHDTLYNVSTIHVPKMLRSIGSIISIGQDIRQIIIEHKVE